MGYKTGLFIKKIMPRNLDSSTTGIDVKQDHVHTVPLIWKI